MTWIAYTVGALAASAGDRWRWRPTCSVMCLFLFEAATVFLNDWFDFDSDRRNRNAGLFSGGSRVLVDGRLERSRCARGSPGDAGRRCGTDRPGRRRPGRSGGRRSPCCTLFAALALVYTVPPLKLSHRGFGEVDVALTHSAGAIMAGYVAQGGAWKDSAPWLLALPLGVSVLPSILLAGCPDREADRRPASARSWSSWATARAVRHGDGGGPRCAPFAALLLLARTDWQRCSAGASPAAACHAVWLWRRLHRLFARDLPERIDGAIVLALTFILWFCVPPLVVLIRAWEAGHCSRRRALADQESSQRWRARRLVNVPTCEQYQQHQSLRQ